MQCQCHGCIAILHIIHVWIRINWSCINVYNWVNDCISNEFDVLFNNASSLVENSYLFFKRLVVSLERLVLKSIYSHSVIMPCMCNIQEFTNWKCFILDALIFLHFHQERFLSSRTITKAASLSFRSVLKDSFTGFITILP